MKKATFIRILIFLLPYKKYFLLGSIFAFAFSITNGITLSSVIPIFNILTPGDERHFIMLNKNEIDILNKDELVNIDDKLIYYKAKLKIRINGIINKTDKFSFLVYICIGLFSIILIRMIFKLLTVYYIGYSANGAIRDIRESLYESILNLPLTYIYKLKTGDIISKIIYDTDLIYGTLGNQLRKFIINLFILITHIALLFYINITLTLMAFIVLMVITVPILIMGRIFKRYTRVEQERIADISSRVLETVEGIRIIKSYQMEDFQINRFWRSTKILFNKKMKKAMIDIGRPQIIEIISSIFLIFLFIYGGKKVLIGEFTKGEFLFFVFTFLYIMNPIKQIANMNNQVKQAESAGERIFELIDNVKEADIIDNNSVSKYQDINILNYNRDSLIIPKKEIRFEDVFFKYPYSEDFVLKNITYTVEPGKTIAIVGRSGVGKTTLVDLVPRFIEPTYGGIYIDDVDIKFIPLKILRHSIGVVSQEVFLFNGTISENIAYGRSDIPFQKIEEAAKIANAHDFILRMPDGYNTHVGERGIMVSGGERQRISIARSILRNPPILILDEATSSLDMESERLVQGALSKLMKSRSTFVIAHRLSTVRNSDMIIVIDDKSIVEMGTHQELLDINGLYQKLHELQFPESSDERVEV